MYNYNPRMARRARIGDKCKDCPYFCQLCEEKYNRVAESHFKEHVLCWCCKHSTDGSCSYIMSGRPYEDSTYKQRELSNGTINTNIRTCEHFERG